MILLFIFLNMEKQLQNYDASYQITYLDFNQKYDELGINFNTDYADYDHLNESGVKKLNRYLSEFIKDHYGL